jgi:ABC-2 type transport system permease protein
MTQFLTFVRKEFYHVFRDQKTLLILFGLPIIQILLFGFALTNEIKNSRIVICDYSKDETTQRIISKITATNNFEIDHVLMSETQIEEAFKSGKIKMAVVFPSNFTRDLQDKRKAIMQVVADASDPNTATTLTSYVTTIVRNYQQDLMQGRLLPMQIISETRMIYNPQLKGTTNYVPGVMSLVLLLVCVMMTSVSIVREKENGTMEVLLVSPFNPMMVIASKAVPYLLLSVVNLSIIILLSVTLLDMPLNGSLALLFSVSTLFILTALSLGLLISNLTNSQQTAMLVSLMGMLLPTMLLTGFMFPLENMPVPLQVIANVLPSKWYYIIVKSVMIKGLGFGAIWKETLILLGMTLFFLVVAIRNFKVRLA